MNREMPEWLKPGLWGAAIGAFALGVILFGPGWAVTAGEAEDMVSKGKEQAVISALTPICVAQFKEATSAQQKRTFLASLEERDPWNREEFVSEHGWATVPGKSEPNDELADACAEELMKLGDA